ncbi:hypothetical protein ACJMK2_017491 [Sinanodonta woodiana]|uniref:Major facilitator superfamily (MFS) profile domain-containing protein n=1 Tax=Sinanodonta woodiana TaxID=1069815 RepID=A0ABD3UCJ0_SINWO
MGKLMTKRCSDVDGGWAWVVLASSFVLHALTYGMAWSTGVYNTIFLHEFRETKLLTAWVGSLTTAVMYGIGPIASMLTNKYGCRVVIILGGIISFLGLFGSNFSPNIYVLFVTFGIITGAGYGLVFIPAITAVSLYFDKRRTLAAGIAASGVGVGNFLFPAMIRWLNNMYNWRASILVLSALNLNIIVCGLLIRPVSTFDFSKEKPKVLDVTPFKKKGYWMLSVNNFLFCCGISAIYIHISAYAEGIGIDEDRSALLISAMGVSNLLGRLLYGVVGHYKRLNNMVIYTVSFALAGVTFFIIPSMTSYIGLMIMVVLFGLFSGCFGTLLVSILVEILGLHRFANGYGCLLLFEAAGQMLGGPIAGAMFDLTGDYSMAFYIGGLFCLLSSIAMIYPIIESRSSSKAKDTEITQSMDRHGSLILVNGSHEKSQVVNKVDSINSGNPLLTA